MGFSFWFLVWVSSLHPHELCEKTQYQNKSQSPAAALWLHPRIWVEAQAPVVFETPQVILKYREGWEPLVEMHVFACKTISRLRLWHLVPRKSRTVQMIWTFFRFTIFWVHVKIFRRKGCRNFSFQGAMLQGGSSFECARSVLSQAIPWHWAHKLLTFQALLFFF